MQIFMDFYKQIAIAHLKKLDLFENSYSTRSILVLFFQFLIKLTEYRLSFI